MTFDINNIGTADQLHTAGQAGFAHVCARVQQLRARGADEVKIVANVVAEVASTLLPTLGTGDDEQFWTELWNIVSALAFGAVTKRVDDAGRSALD